MAEKIKEYGWRVESIDELTLYAVLRGRPLNNRTEEFIVRLSCDYYPTHPPDAKFVNPETLEYEPGKDLHHLPKLTAPYCQVHPSYGWDHPYPYGPQLVCSSMTLGYYFSNHNPTADQAWEPGGTQSAQRSIPSIARYSPRTTQGGTRSEVATQETETERK